MSLVHRLIGGTGGVSNSPYSAQPSGGNPKLVSLMRKNQREDEGEGEATPSLFSSLYSPPPDNNAGFLNLSLQTQAFGPIPTGIGVSERGDVIRVNTAALEGDIDCGSYEF